MSDDDRPSPAPPTNVPLITVRTSHEVRDAAADVAVLPVGSFEQHGGHLPLATDTVVAVAVAEALAARYPLLVLPPLTLSCSQEHSAWPGTVSISAATLHAVVADVAASLRRSGVDRLVLVNGHGGNYVLQNTVQELRRGGGRAALFPTPEQWDAARAGAGIRTGADDDMHAGELETSLMLYTHPDLVGPGYDRADEVTGPRTHMLTRGLHAYSGTGVVGRPSLASADSGRRLLEHLVDAFAGSLAALSAE